MKKLHALFCAVLATTATDAAERGPRPSRDLEIITPLTTNLFQRSTNLVLPRDPRTGALLIGPSTNQVRTSVLPGRTTNLNTVTLTNAGAGTPTSSLLIGPVFPATSTNFSPTGRGSGFSGLTSGVPGAAEASLLTNALPPGFETGIGPVNESQVPGPAVGRPASTPPLAPPIPPNPPTPAVPGQPATAPPNVPGSGAPAPGTPAPLAPPAAPAQPAVPPSPPPPPASGATP